MQLHLHLTVHIQSASDDWLSSERVIERTEGWTITAVKLLQSQHLHFLRSVFIKTNHNKEGCAVTAATSGLPWTHFSRRVAFWENSFSVKGGNSFKLCDWSCTPECAPWSSGEPESTGSSQRRSVIRGKQGYPEASVRNIQLLSKKCAPICLLFIRETWRWHYGCSWNVVVTWWPILIKAVDYINEIIFPPWEFGKGKVYDISLEMAYTCVSKISNCFPTIKILKQCARNVISISEIFPYFPCGYE
jgi:hypothetical protein